MSRSRCSGSRAIAIERGDHSIFLGEVVEASVPTVPVGRADDATLILKDLGENTFYGG